MRQLATALMGRRILLLAATADVVSTLDIARAFGTIVGVTFDAHVRRAYPKILQRKPLKAGDVFPKVLP